MSWGDALICILLLVIWVCTERLVYTTSKASSKPPADSNPPPQSPPSLSAPHYRFVKRNGVYFWIDDPYHRRVPMDPNEVLEASVAWIMARHKAEHPEDYPGDFRRKP